MYCLNCGRDISNRVSTKRCVECAKVRRTIRMRDACTRYRGKKKVLIVCWTCGKTFKRGHRSSKEWCSTECIHGPDLPAAKTWPCKNCGVLTTNRLYCSSCRRSNEDIESMTEHRR